MSASNKLQNEAKYDADVKEIAMKIQQIIREQFDHYTVGSDTYIVEGKLHQLIENCINFPINRCKTCKTELPRNNPPEFCQKCGGPELKPAKISPNWGAPNPAWDEWN